MLWGGHTQQALAVSVAPIRCAEGEEGPQSLGWALRFLAPLTRALWGSFGESLAWEQT